MKRNSLIFLFFCITSWAWAQEVIVVEDKNQLIDITYATHFFEDKQREFSIEKVLDAYFVDRFQKAKHEIPNFGIVSYPVWCKFTIQNLTGEKCFLAIKNCSLDTLTLYLPSPSGSFLAKQTGNYLPRNQRDLNTSTFAFELSETSQPQTYYMRTVATHNLILPMKVGNKDALWHSISSFYWIEGLYFGILLFVIIYNFFIYLSLREVSYGYYVLYGISLLLSACYSWGYFGLLNSSFNHFTIRYSYFAVGLPSITAILFAVSFLQIANKAPAIHLMFKVFLCLFIAYFGVDYLAFLSPHIFRSLYNLTALVLIFCLLYAGYTIYRKKNLPARFYLLAWGIGLFFVVWLLLVRFDILASPPFIHYQLQIGTALEMLFLSFALADRIKLLEKEKIESQKQLLASVQTSELVIKEQKVALESSIKERTAELEQKQKEVIGQNEELTQQQEELVRQQELIEQRNKELSMLNWKMQTNELVLRKAYAKIVDIKLTIANKNEELKKYSENLEQQIQERTKQITQANAELIKQNNQLEQFAFITAHNLRAPVARLLGLGNILDTQNPQNPDNIFVVEKMATVSNELDTVIKDLNIILEIKKGINELIYHVKLSDKFGKVCDLLQNQITESKAIITSDFSAVDVIESVSPYIESILYNLISNAIKYRSYKRVPIIHIQTTLEQEGFTLSISDNGLGMNLDDNKGKVFGLYQRFHDHIEGKGLGLYLVKTQVEAMGGSISLESTQGVGTTFRLFFRRY